MTKKDLIKIFTNKKQTSHSSKSSWILKFVGYIAERYKKSIFFLSGMLCNTSISRKEKGKKMFKSFAKIAS